MRHPRLGSEARKALAILFITEKGEGIRPSTLCKPNAMFPRGGAFSASKMTDTWKELERHGLVIVKKEKQIDNKKRIAHPTKLFLPRKKEEFIIDVFPYIVLHEELYDAFFFSTYALFDKMPGLFRKGARVRSAYAEAMAEHINEAIEINAGFYEDKQFQTLADREELDFEQRRRINESIAVGKLLQKEAQALTKEVSEDEHEPA